MHLRRHKSELLKTQCWLSLAGGCSLDGCRLNGACDPVRAPLKGRCVSCCQQMSMCTCACLHARVDNWVETELLQAMVDRH